MGGDRAGGPEVQEHCRQDRGAEELASPWDPVPAAFSVLARDGGDDLPGAAEDGAFGGNGSAGRVFGPGDQRGRGGHNDRQSSVWRPADARSTKKARAGGRVRGDRTSPTAQPHARPNSRLSSSPDPRAASGGHMLWPERLSALLSTSGESVATFRRAAALGGCGMTSTRRSTSRSISRGRLLTTASGCSP